MTTKLQTWLVRPTGDEDATNKGWVESKIPKGLHHLVVYVKGSPNSHTVEYKNDHVLSLVYRDVTPNKQLVFNFKNDLPNGFYTYDFDIDKNNDVAMDVLLYGECGGSGFDCKTIYRYWASDVNNNEKEFNIKSDSGQGKRFIRFTGEKVQVHGQFELVGNHIYNHGKPYTLNLESGKGNTYEMIT